MEGAFLTLNESQTRKAVRQGFERALRLPFAQRGAQAIVDALATGECLRRVRAAQIERLGLRKDGGIAAGCGAPGGLRCSHGCSNFFSAAPRYAPLGTSRPSWNRMRYG